MYNNQLGFALLLAIPIACIAWTVTQEDLFEEMRRALQEYRRRQVYSLWRRKLAYAPTCPYCFSHYVAALFVALFRFRMLTDDWRGYLVSLFTLVFLANVYIGLYHILRVVLRMARAKADRAERQAQLLRRRANRTLRRQRAA